MKITLSTRRVLVSTFYAGSAAFFIANLATHAGTYTAVDLALTVAGVVPWGLAAIHGLTRRCLAKKNELVRVAPPEETPHTLTDSTHATINASLHVTSASLFIASDMYYVTAPNPVLVTRLIGSFLWLKSAGITLWLARNQPEHPVPETAVTLCGLNTPALDFIAEVEFLAAGVLYALAIWNDSTLLPLKAAGNFCWLIGCTHETIRRYLDLQKSRQGLPNTEQHARIPDYTPPLTHIVTHNPAETSPDTESKHLTTDTSPSLHLTPR